MLQEFTWQYFLIAVLVLTLIWYVGILLIFYRKELFGLFGHRKKDIANTFRDTEPLPHRWEKGVEKLDDEEEKELMGKAKLPEGMMLIGSTDFGFGGSKATAKEQQLGLVPDLLQDIRQLFKVLVEKDGKKKDFFVLFEEMKGGYPKMAGHPNVDQINEFITDHAPFHFTAEEMENLWD